MTLSEFMQLGDGKKSHAVYAEEILMDLYTPLEIYLRLASKSKQFLLESADVAGAGGRYSIIGFGNDEVISFDGSHINHDSGQKKVKINTKDPLTWLQNFVDEKKEGLAVPASLSAMRFIGGLVGYFGYDLVFHLESHLRKKDKPDPCNIPLFQLLVCKQFIIFDTWRQSISLCIITNLSASGYRHAKTLAKKVRRELKIPLAKIPQSISRSVASSKLTHHDYFPKQIFTRCVSKLKKKIGDGVCMQVVLSRLKQIPFARSSELLYRFLRLYNPSPYLFLIRFSGFDLIGSSPELLLSVDKDRMAMIRPVAGTRPRGKTPTQDDLFAKELINDEKERAEHTMLIDLGRNDLSRSCESNSISLSKIMELERYASVMHLSSTITGKIKQQCTALDVFRYVFPAGTLSGAPKVMAMQLIEDMEPTRRGAYGGAVGYLSFNGVLDVAITIRSIIRKKNYLYVQSGAGIVYDSVPIREYQECENKAAAMLRAIAASVTK